MDSKLWLFFVVSTLFISATPGANMLWAFHCGLHHGVRKTLWTLAGLSAGLLLLLVISLDGIGYFSQNNPAAFQALKLAGAVYLAWLGWRLWRNTSASFDADQPDAPPAPSGWRLFRDGIFVSLSNPKAILFFAAFFPKFLIPSQPLAPQYLVLALTFFCIETAWQLIYTCGGRALAAWFMRENHLRLLHRACAIIFLLIAASLAAEAVLARA
ncbi:MAG: LysE family transporter [Rhodocyclaceae bacterium]|nr:LysE family transporter [Rhodocyclaceae bacterium]